MDIHPIPLIHRQQVTQRVVDTFINQVFSWGTNDCCRLIASALVWAGLPDPMADMDYNTYRGALKLMKARNVCDLEEWIERDIGLKPIPLAKILVGDIVSFPSDTPGFAQALGIYIGEGHAITFMPYPDGSEKCTRGSVKVAEKAWRLIPSIMDK
jgi:hypothetical protein